MLPRGWVQSWEVRALAGIPASGAEVRRRIVQDARKMMGVYYLWGGCSGFGTDCSGLAQWAHRLSGYVLPRDADMQYAAGKPVEPPYQAGDLLFFNSENDQRKIGHVGISTGGWKMIHSSRSRNGVYEEDVEKVEHLRKTFAGARTYVERG
jgi:cell wall-associated NlpC family hydrolase